MPTIRERLTEQKEGLVSLAVPLAETIMTELAARLAEDAKKNLGNSWTRSDIVKKLFA